MVKVNLLPPKERTKKQVIKENLWGLFLGILTIIIIATFSLGLIIYENDVKEEIKNTEAQVVTQKNRVDKYKNVEEIVSNLNKNISIIQGIQKQNPQWSQILTDFQSKIPAEIKLEEISTSIVTTSAKDANPANQPIVLTIRGLSGNQFLIAKFKEALSLSKYFEYIDIQSSTWQQDKNNFEFAFQAKLKI